MKRIVLLLATILMVQSLWAQLSDNFPDATGSAADVSYAPVYVFTNGPGKIYIFDRNETVVDGQMLPVGGRFRLVAVPDPGYEFVSWYPVNVFITTVVTFDAEGNPNPPTTSIDASPVPQPVDHRVLKSEVQPITVLYDDGLTLITEGSGWQANFEPKPSPGRRRHVLEGTPPR